MTVARVNRDHQHQQLQLEMFGLWNDSHGIASEPFVSPQYDLLCKSGFMKSKCDLILCPKSNSEGEIPVVE